MTKSSLSAVALLVSAVATDVAHSGDAASAIPSVVSVLPQWPGHPPNADEPEGSGIVVDDGRHIVTAAHVLGQAQNIQIRTSDGTIVQAHRVAMDKATDLALLRVDEALPALKWSGDARLGEPACAIGNSFGLGLSMTCGTISAVHRSGIGFNAIEDFVQTDAAVNPGASGGALVDGEGKLIGVLSAIFTKRSDANIGINFAVSAPLARRVVAGLQSGDAIRWSLGGLGLRPYPRKGQTGRQAAEVVSVRQGSPAMRAGFKPGDRIVNAGERRIRKPQDLRAALARLMPGGRVDVDYVRDGKARRTRLRMD